ncbi:MAG TPA: DUF3237 family protein [Steroidobacteraceae bacterium]|nr:DUF3237 family protein [Steroidobacteraceae bacterium]
MQPTEQSAPSLSESPDTARRALLQGGMLVAGGFILGPSGAATPAAPAVPAAPTAHNPVAEFAFSIFATIDGAVSVGDTATGQVRAVPITGGEVVGKNIAGRVIPGGADWQRTRSDGVTEIEATYAMEMSDKTVVKVVNRGIIAPAAGSAPAYFRTAVEFTAPQGAWQWLNEAVFLCSAGTAQGRPGTVQVDVYKLV